MLLHLRHDMVESVISCLSYGDKGLSCSKVCLVSTEDGGEVFTGISFLSMFSKQEDIEGKNEEPKILIPAPSHVIENLLVLLSSGSFFCESIGDIYCLGNTASLLGITANDEWVIDSQMSDVKRKALNYIANIEFVSDSSEKKVDLKPFDFEYLLEKVSTVQDTVFKCNILGCRKFYVSQGGLVVHQTIKHFAHSPEAAKIIASQCPVCEQRFHKGHLADHLHRHLPDRKRSYTCSKCGSCFYEKNTITRHMKSMHSSSIEGSFPYCIIDTKNGELLENSVKDFTESFSFPGPNKIKDEEFKFDDVLVTVPVGEDKESFKCDECLKVYTCQGGLIVHKVVKHFPTSEAAAQLVKSQCPVCKKCFNKTHLGLHLTLHLSRRQRHLCDKCDATFSSKRVLTRHVNYKHK